MDTELWVKQQWYCEMLAVLKRYDEQEWAYYREYFPDVERGDESLTEARVAHATTWISGSLHVCRLQHELQAAKDSLMAEKAKMEAAWAQIRMVTASDPYPDCCPETRHYATSSGDCACECHAEDDPPETPADIRDTEGWL